MRKIFSTVMLVAAAAMTFASCQREEMNAPKETFSTTLPLNTEGETTTTDLGAGNTVLWGENESVALFVKDSNAEPATTFENSTATSDFNGKASASFTFELKGIAESDSYTIGGIYPASASNGIDNNKNAEAYKIALPATQNASVNNYDPSAFIMVLKPETVEDVPPTYTAWFRRAVALNKITLTGVKENISSVEITVEPSQEGLYLAGRRYVDLTTAEFGEIYSFQTNTVTVNAPYTGSSIDVWFTSWGMELKPGDKLTVKMTSATKIYTRTITANVNGIKFVEGDLNTLKVNMASAEEETTGLLENGDYLIAGVLSNNVYVASAYVSGNNLKSVQVTVSDNKIPEVEGLSNCKMTITKSTEDGYAGMYTITDVNGKYLYAASNSGNQLKSREDPDVNSYWKIEPEDDGTYSIVASKSSNRNVMQMNPNNNNPLFNCYASLDLSAYKRVILYPYSMVVPDTTPKVTVVEGVERNVGAEGGNLTFTCTLKNLDGETLSVDENSDKLTYSVSGNVVTVIVAENTTSDQKIFNATIKCGSVEVPITITQAGKPSADAPVEVTDVLTLSALNVTYSSYTNWSGKTFTSNAVYAGNSYNSNNSIQLRDTGPSGIVTTQSGGKLKKIIVEWHSSTNTKRYITIYGKNSSYSSSSDLHDTNKRGESLGQIKYGTTELVISGDFTHFGILASGALYLPKIQVVWESGNTGGNTTDPETPGGGGETPTPEPEEPETPVDPTPDPNPGEVELVTEEISGTFTYDSSAKTLSLTTASGIKITQSATGGNAVNQSYNQVNTLRIYRYNTLTFSGKTITKIEIYHSDKKGANVGANVGTYEMGDKISTWTGESDFIEIKNAKTGSTNVQLQPTAIKVTYKK